MLLITICVDESRFQLLQLFSRNEQTLSPPSDHRKRCLSVPANQLNFSELVPNPQLLLRNFTFATGRLFKSITRAARMSTCCNRGSSLARILRVLHFLLIALISDLQSVHLAIHLFSMATRRFD